MKRTKRWISFLLTAGMLLSGMPVFAFTPPGEAQEVLKDGYSSSQDQYAIYPVPQDADYGAGGEFLLDETVSVVSETGVDEYTTDFLDEILEKYDRTKAQAAAPVESGSQILLGIKGSGGAVDTYANDISLSKSDLFEQTDSYLLSADNGTILILGDDTDSVYYGLATLQMMFSSFNGKRFLNVQIEDFAVMKMRGFIEGFYGGWNYEGRESLMRFARDYKMNTYIYASKSDAYHKNDQLYPESDISKIKELVDVGKATKVEYGWSIHISYFFGNSDPYETKLERLMKKFQQLYDVGVRKFAILNDDFGAGSLADVVKLLNDVTQQFLIPKDCRNLTYCMQGYNKGWALDGYGQYGQEMEAMKDVDASVDLFWTGDGVNAPITQETVDFVKERTNHEAVTWLNYPVNEHDHSGIFLGEISHYVRDGVTGLAGAMSNPSRFTEANKVGLFQLAALFWNNHNYLANAVNLWEDSFKYLQPEVYEAYLKIARNVANCPNSGRVPNGFPESEYIREELASVGEKIKKGKSIANDPDAQMLKHEFEEILDAITVFRAECSNETLVEELDPWLKGLADVATAGKAVLEALFAAEEKDVDSMWKGLGTAGAAMDRHNTYPTFTGGNNMAAAGSKRLVPFVSTALISAKNQMASILDPGSTEFTPSFYGRMGGTDRENDANSAKIFDGDESTFAAYSTNQQAGDYFGIDMGKTIPVTSIKILQAKTGENDTADANGNWDYFHNAVLEYSVDGDTWEVIKEYPEDRTPRRISEDVDIDARFIRLRLTKKGTANKAEYYTEIREFSVNGDVQKEEEYGLYASESVSAEVTRENLTYHLTSEGSVSLAAGEYVGIKMDDLYGVEAVSASPNPALSLQYSENSIIWNELSGEPNGLGARYIRLYNGTDGTVSFSLSDFAVTVFAGTVNPVVIDYNAEFSQLNTGSNSGTWEALFDGIKDDTPQSYIWTNVVQAKGQYIVVDLGKEVPIYDVVITQKDGFPIFYNSAFYLSANKSDWGEPIATTTYTNNQVTGEYREVKNGWITIKRDDLDGRSARYLRIEVTGPGASNRFLRIDEIEFNTTVPKSDDAVSRITSDTLTGDFEKMIDGDTASVYTSGTVSNGSDAIKYTVTENNKLTSVIILQNPNEITHAEVKATVYDGSEISEITLGTLEKGSNSFYLDGKKDILDVRVIWPEGTTPCIYEILTKSGEAVHTVSFEGDGAPDLVQICPEGRAIMLPENTFVKDGFLFKGWSDGNSIYEAGRYYTMGTEDVVFTAVWELATQKVVSVTVTPSSVVLAPNETKQLAASVLPENATTKKVVWSSGNLSVATVDPDNGLVKAVSEGTAVITASATDGSQKTGSCTVTVKKTGVTPPPGSGSQQNPNVKPGEPLKELVIYEKGNDKFKVTSLTNKTAEYAGWIKEGKKIVIPDSVTLADGNTYNVTSIAPRAFKNCTKATSAEIGKNVLTIGKEAFAGCKKLKKVTINSRKLTTIGAKAFYNCKVLKSIIIKSNALKKVEKNALKGIHKKAVIKVPSAKLKKYQKLLSKKGQKKTVKIKK